MVENYLHVSKQLKAVFLLIDIRHDPSENDIIMYDWIVHQGFDPIIVATKLDKINKSQIKKHLKMLKDGLKVKPGTQILPFSCLTKQGKEEIWDVMDELVGYISDKKADTSTTIVDETKKVKVRWDKDRKKKTQSAKAKYSKSKISKKKK